MARKPVSMRKIREIIRLAATAPELSRRQIATSCRLSPTTVSKVVDAAEAASLRVWPLPDMTEADLRQKLFGTKAGSTPSKALPGMAELARELSRPGVTRQLLWEEYRQDHPDGYGYTQFCEYLRQWKATQDPTMRFEHTAGEKVFVDWAGQTIRYGDGSSSEKHEAYLFVAVLGASNYTFASVWPDMKMASWISAHMQALEFFGGVPKLIVPDNTRTAVSKVCYYDPETNRTYQEFAEHYKTTILPARAHRPRDKAKVENGVQQAERRILAALRNCQFLSLGDLCDGVAAKNRELNARPFSKMDGSRLELFQSLDLPALNPLPARAFELGTWQTATVYLDYHIQVDLHYYSVPHTHIGKKVDVRLTGRTVEIYHDGQRLATHQRSDVKGKATTLKEHRTEAHRQTLERSARTFLDKAVRVGPQCEKAVATIFENVPHVEMGFRSCAGILRLAGEHGAERLEAACDRALQVGIVRYRTIANMLRNGLEAQVDPGLETIEPPVQHSNIRGASYYRDTGGAGC